MRVQRFGECWLLHSKTGDNLLLSRCAPSSPTLRIYRDALWWAALTRPAYAQPFVDRLADTVFGQVLAPHPTLLETFITYS